MDSDRNSIFYLLNETAYHYVKSYKKGNESMKKIIIMLAIIFLCGGLMALSPMSGNGKSAENDGAEAETGHDLIKFIVPFEAGGGTDIYGRFMTPYFSEHMDSKPRVQVENIPGGASITGTNHYSNSISPDGSNLLTSSASSHVPFILDQSSVDYDLDKLKPIIGSPSGGVVYTTPENAEKINNGIDTLDQTLFHAGISPTGLDLSTLLSYEVLGLDVKAVLGYEGRGPSRVAFEQQESNIDFQTTTAYNNNVQPMIDNGKAVPLYTLGQIDKDGKLIRDPQFPDLPTVKEVYIDQYGEEPSGPAWDAYLQLINASYTMSKIIWVHEDAPKEEIDKLQASAENIAQDPQFKEASLEILEGYDVFTGDELQERIDGAFNISDENKEYIQNYLYENYEVDITKL